MSMVISCHIMAQNTYAAGNTVCGKSAEHPAASPPATMACEMTNATTTFFTRGIAFKSGVYNQVASREQATRVRKAWL